MVDLEHLETRENLGDTGDVRDEDREWLCGVAGWRVEYEKS